uniref:Uncharacterized protein n=1 Tax=Arundo donax TaxID=35708 RepID=A0A0A9A4E6_ARUDO
MVPRIQNISSLSHPRSTKYKLFYTIESLHLIFLFCPNLLCYKM